MMRISVLIFFAVLGLAGLTYGGDAPAAKAPLGEQPIRVSSDRLEAAGSSRRVTFSGDVVARQGDVTIYGQELTILFLEDNREIDRVEIAGDVRIVQGERVATGQRGIYYSTEGKIVLSGSPRVHQGADFIEGEEITVFLNEERSTITGQDGSRVNAVFHPKEESK